jgi:hypothetical protein
MKRVGSIAGLSLLSASLAQAQSFNIDFGDSSGSPSDAYAAAGVPGFWNAVPLMPFGQNMFPLRGLDGEPTAVVISGYIGGNIFGDNDPATTGDDEALFDDYLGGGGDGIYVLHIGDLSSGQYRVILYGWTPNDPAEFTISWIDMGYPGRHEVARSGGAWPGHLELGVTHDILHANVTDAELVIAYGGDIKGIFGNLAGIQISRLGDVCLADWNNDGTANSQDFFDFLVDFFEGHADFNADRHTTSQDFFDFLEVFFAGC